MDFKKILKNEKAYPIGGKKWKHIEIDHNLAEDEIRTLLRYNVKDKNGHDMSGIYCYKLDKSVLYIGKAVSLYDRLWSHYCESQRPVSGDTKNDTYHKFFKKYRFLLDVYWLKKEIEEERQVIEIMLQKLYGSRFEDFRNQAGI